MVMESHGKVMEISFPYFCGNPDTVFTFIFLVLVMEVACGEYGDMVPRLVVSTKNGKCEQYQQQKKVTNCDKVAKDNLLEEGK